MEFTETLAVSPFVLQPDMEVAISESGRIFAREIDPWEETEWKAISLEVFLDWWWDSRHSLHFHDRVWKELEQCLLASHLGLNVEISPQGLRACKRYAKRELGQIWPVHYVQLRHNYRVIEEVEDFDALQAGEEVWWLLQLPDRLHRASSFAEAEKFWEEFSSASESLVSRSMWEIWQVRLHSSAKFYIEVQEDEKVEGQILYFVLTPNGVETMYSFEDAQKRVTVLKQALEVEN